MQLHACASLFNSVYSFAFSFWFFPLEENGVSKGALPLESIFLAIWLFSSS